MSPVLIWCIGAGILRRPWVGQRHDVCEQGRHPHDYHHASEGGAVFTKDDDLVNWSGPVVIEPKVRPGQDGSRISNWDPETWVIGNTTYALQGVYPLKTGTEASLMKSTDHEELGLRGAVYEQGDARCSAKHR